MRQNVSSRRSQGGSLKVEQVAKRVFSSDGTMATEGSLEAYSNFKVGL